jgi:HisJ family histidinol phosphate phosphatase
MRYEIDHDIHIHSHLSLCSNDPMQTKENILAYAIRNNLKYICLTDHFWDENIPKANEFYEPQNFEHIKKALPLPESDSVKFYFGCETEMDKNYRLGISEERFDSFDFVIIPTTHLHMMSFTIDEKDTSLERCADLYVARLDKLLDMDIPFHKIGIAHLTCPLMAPNNKDDHLKVLDLIPDKVFKELFSKIAKKKAGFELNFSFFQYEGESLERVLRPYRIAKECNCKFYLGSDAHHPQGFDYAIKNFSAIIDALDLKESDKFKIKN